MMTVEQIIRLRQTDTREYSARDVAWCHCGGPLEFTTDGIGQVIESCSRCHRHGQLTTVTPRGTNESLPPRKARHQPVPVPGAPCSVCHAPTTWKGQGRKPDLCDVCRPAERRKLIEKHNALRKEYDRQRNPRRKHRRAA